MKNKKKAEIKVGITVIFGIIVLVLVFAWAKNFDPAADRITLFIRFDSVAGLSEGDNVTVNGVKKGTVDEIKVDGNYVLVKTSLESDVELNEDAEFAVMMLDLMGGKKIEVSPGSSAQSLNYDEIANGNFAGDISTAMAVLSSVDKDLVQVIREVKITLTNMNNILSDEQFGSDVKKSVSNLSEVSENLNRIINNNEESLNELISSGSKFASLSANFIEENKDNLSSTISELETTIANANEILGKINSFSDEIKNEENNIGKILYDEKMIEDLKILSERIIKLTETIQEQINGKGLKTDVNLF